MVSLRVAAFQNPAFADHKSEHVRSTDAVPKKRGPKTDVLEALLKRVDGLEKRLQDEKNPVSPTSSDKQADDFPSLQPNGRRNTIDVASINPCAAVDAHPAVSISLSPNQGYPNQMVGSGSLQGLPLPSESSQSSGSMLSEMILDTYFTRLHGKPFFILDESSTRQRYQLDQLPAHLSLAISAMTLR